MITPHIKNNNEGVETMSKNRDNTTSFAKKQNLEKYKYNGKLRTIYANDFTGLCLRIGKKEKSYYAHWSIKKINKDGKVVRVGKKRMLADWNVPLAEVKEKLRANYDKWKKESRASSTGNTVESLVRSFIKDGAKGVRVRTRGKRLNYKKKTSTGYISFLKTYLLSEGKNTDGREYKDLMKMPVSMDGVMVEGNIKDIPVDELSRRDVDIFMFRLKDKPAAANNTLAALSAAIEWDMKKADSLLQGKSNPCLRVVKYEIQKDKRVVELEKVLEIRSYISNMFEKTSMTDFTPHFFSYWTLLIENGERFEDFEGLYWEKPNDPAGEKEKGCTGWLMLEQGMYHIIDSKNRKPATEKLSEETIKILKRLDALRYTSESWCVKSKWLFPKKTDPSQHITESSYRWQLQRFMYKFGFATRKLVRGKKTRKLYSYKLKRSFKHLRKTFATNYSKTKGDVATQKRMRHSSLDVTQQHYIHEDKENAESVDIYSPRKERSKHKLAAISGGLDEKK